MAADVIEVLSVGIASFIATNIDDLFILVIFFSKQSFPPSQIVLGQYLGMGLLIGLSLVGSLVALVIPQNLIGLIGLFPIAIGIRELIELRKKSGDKNDDEQEIMIDKQMLGRNKNRWTSAVAAYLPFLTVATVTFSGGEEIGVYTSVFATYSAPTQIITIVSVVMILTGVWCVLAHYLVNHTFLAARFRRIADMALPFVLIGLGIYILTEAFLFYPAVASALL